MAKIIKKRTRNLKKPKLLNKKIETRGRPRRDDFELALEGYKRYPKAKRTRMPGPLTIPKKLKTEGERCLYFFGRFLKHTMGEWAGKPFEPLPWQEELIRAIFDTKTQEGLRRYRTALLMISRKNGKTILACGLLLYWLAVRSEMISNLRIYSGATTKDQAGLIFDGASQMVLASPELSKRIKVIPRYKKLVNHRTKATYEALSSDVSGKYGLFNAELIIFDEMFLQKNFDFVSALQKSQGNLKEPLFLVLSTAGNDRESPLYDLYYYGKQIEKGLFSDPSFYFNCFEVGENDDWTLPENWEKANPSMAYGVRKKEEMVSQLVRALRIPREESEFKQFYLDMWVSSATSWVNISDWNKCFDPGLRLEDFTGKPCYMGIDLSQTRDLTACVLLFQEADKYILFPFFWLPKENLLDKAKVEKTPYDVWARAGHILLTEGNVIDYGAIIAKVSELAKVFDVKGIGIDPYNATQVLIELQGAGLPIQTVRQGFLSMNAPVKEMERAITGHFIRHDGNPVLTWMSDNVTLARDSTGNVKIEKKKANAKVDGISAALDALAVFLNKPVEQGSVYDTRGILTLGASDTYEPEIVKPFSVEKDKGPSCPRCGKDISGGQEFCLNCGGRITNERELITGLPRIA